MQAEPTIKYRNKVEQLPSNTRNQRIVNTIYEYFRDDHFRFESFAASLVRLMDKNIVSCVITRPLRDEGRDALGLYRIGHRDDNVKVEYALEAKCFEPRNGIGRALGFNGDRLGRSIAKERSIEMYA